MSPNAVINKRVGWALFLDVDGTLLEIAETPEDVRVSDGLKELLCSLCLHLDGALALISGRSVAALDELFAPLRFCAAGVHGCERRDGAGCLIQPHVDSQALDHAREVLAMFVAHHPGLVLEDKRYGIALHYRRSPHLRDFVRTAMSILVSELGKRFVLQEGSCVCEIRPAAHTKGTAIRSFMSDLPFRGRTPIFIGDDITDEDGFAFVNTRRGMSIRVGTRGPSVARYTLGSVGAVLEWLREIPPIRPPDAAALTLRMSKHSEDEQLVPRNSRP